MRREIEGTLEKKMAVSYHGPWVIFWGCYFNGTFTLDVQSMLNENPNGIRGGTQC
jgi:hypothetical protein